MSDNNLQVRLLHATKTHDQWTQVVSYPKRGEVCLEAINSSGATAFKIKIGDGTRPYCKPIEDTDPVQYDFTSDQVLPYFGSVIETSGTVNVVAISTYNTTKKKLSFYTLGLSASTSGGSTTITPTIASSPYLEIIEGDGVEFTTDETGTVKEFYINLAATTEATATTITDGGTFTTITPDSNHKATKYTTFTLPSIADAIAELDTDSPLALVEYDSSTTTLSIYTISETDGVISKSSTAVTTIDLSGVAPVQDVQINSTSILDNSGNANLAVEGTYNASSNKIATESTVSDAVEGLDVNGYAQVEIDTTTTSGQTTLTIKGIEEVNGEIAVDTTNNTSIVIDGTYNASTNKIATESTVSDVIATLDGNATTTDITSSHDVIVSVSETDGIVSSAKKTLVAGDKIDIDIPTTGTSIGDIIISHEDIDTTATDVASTITTDTSSVIDEKELSVITGIKVDAQGHITHIDKDVSTNLVAADIKSPVEMIDDEMWTYRTTGGDITIDKDIANVTDVKGETLVFNQLVKIPTTDKSITNNNVTITDNRDGSYSVITTQDGASDNVVLQLTVSLVNGHKYLAKGCPKNGSSSTYKMYLLGYGNDFGEGQIFTATSTDTSVSIPRITIYSGTIITSPIVFKPQIIDLTLMFGAGNEPSTVEEFEAIYPLPYYNYNEGTLINNNASAIETTGFNQWDEQWEMISNYLRPKNYISVLPNTQYFFHIGSDIGPSNLQVIYYDSEKNNLGDSGWKSGEYQFTTPQNCAFIKFSIYASVYGSTYNNDICINLSDPTKNGTYEPYEKHTFYFDKVLQSEGSLATVTGKLNGVGESVAVFPDGLKSAGSVYDEIKGNVAIKRIGSVDLGDLSWVYASVYGFYSNTIAAQIKKPSSNAYDANMISSKFISATFNAMYAAGTTGNLIACNADGLIGVNSSLTDVTAFKAAMSGVVLYYELATPETYILDQTVTGNYIVDDNGTEKLLPEGVDSTTGLPLTTPFSGIITYQSNFKDVVLDTVDKVSKYKNPVRSKEDKPQTTGKVAVYDSDSTVKSSTFAISNTAIDPEGISNETTVPTVDAVVDYIEDVVDTEVTVQDITTTDDDISGNGGIRITNTGTTYDVHHADITQSADVTHTITPEEGDNNEAVVKLVTGVITDDFGHVKGKEVISSDKLIAADIKAPMTFTDKDTWLIRPTAGSHDVISEDIAKVVEVEGNSCVWNQLINPSLFTTSGDISASIDSNGVISLSGTASRTYTNCLGNIPVITGHKYFIKCTTIANPNNVGYKININHNVTSKTFNPSNTAMICTASTSGGAGVGFAPITVDVDYTGVKVAVVLIDLTMNSIDNYSISQVEAWLAEHIGTKPYYAYNAGTILSAQTTGIKTYGQNLLNPTTRQAKLIPYEWEDNSNVYTIKNVPSGATATFTPDATGVAETVDISGGSLDITSYGSGILELSAATADTYVCMKWDEQKDDDVVPFEEHTQDFDVRKVYGKNNGVEYQCYPNGMRSAGSVHDILTASEAVVKVGSVDMGELTFGNYQAVSEIYPYGFTGTTILGKKGGYYNMIAQSYGIHNSFAKDKMFVGSASNANCYIVDSSFNGYTGTQIAAALSGVMLFYELATPINYTDLVYRDGGIDRPLADVLVNINVNNWGIEEQLLTPYVDGNPTSTAATITMQYKSNFKDAIKDLIDKVNNQKNPVMGVSNTGQTVDKIAIYDSASTVHSSSYSPSNATIVENATGNNIILPAVETIVNYVNSKLSSALTYKGTISEWADLPTSGQNTGDMYIAANSFTEGGTTYNAGDFFIWNGTSWDIVSGTTSVVNSNPTITLDGSTYQVGTVDGVPLQITTPDLNVSDPSASGNTLTFIDSVSQSDGLISATKKTVYSASTTQSGVVTLSSGIETTSNEDSKIPTAYDTLTNLNNRDVDSGTITNDIASLSKRMVDDDSGSQTYGDWINKPFYPTTKFAAINDFSTAFGTNYPDLNTIEGLSTTGFLKRTGDNTWILTDDTGKMKWLDEVTQTYTYTPASVNNTELGSYIHNFNGITSVEIAQINSTNYGFKINVPILSSSLATVGTVLKGKKSQGVDALPTWEKLSIEEIDELDNLGSGTGYLKRKAGATAGTYEWELSTPDSTTVVTTKNDGTNATSSSTAGPGIKVTTNGTTTYHKVPFSAIENDTSTGDYKVTIILNGNFS